MATIFRPDWGSGTISYPTSYKSVNRGGADAQNADFAELQAGEAIETSVASPAPAPDSTTVVTSTAADFSASGLVLLEVGPEANGYYDSSVEITHEWDQYFSSTALNDSGYCPVALEVTRFSVIAGPAFDPEAGLFTGDAFISLYASQDAGANFTWEMYWIEGGAGQSEMTDSDVADNAWHKLKLVWKPGTVNGAQVGSYFPRDSDGYLHFYIDGVLVYTHTGIALDIQANALIGAADKGYGFWHGYAGLLGPIGDTHLYNGSSSPTPTTLPPAVIVNSVPIECCGPNEVNHGNTPGDLAPVVEPTWYPSCDGLGTVEEAPDQVDPESWVS